MKRILTLIALVTFVSAKSQLLVGSNGSTPFLSDSALFWSITMDANYGNKALLAYTCLLYTSPSPRDRQKSRMPSSA